jgi:hypothetical protein
LLLFIDEPVLYPPSANCMFVCSQQPTANYEYLYDAHRSTAPKSTGK